MKNIIGELNKIAKLSSCNDTVSVAKEMIERLEDKSIYGSNLDETQEFVNEAQSTLP